MRCCFGTHIQRFIYPLIKQIRKFVRTVGLDLFFNMIKTRSKHSAPRSICLVRLSALGDVLMFVPLIRTLQRYLPGVRLTWVISPPAYDLVAGMDGVRFVVIKKPQTIGDYWRFKKLMQGRSFDVLLATQACYRTNFLYPLIHAQRKIGYDWLRAKDLHRLFVHESILPGRDHTLEGFLKFAEAIGVSKTDLR